MPGGERGLVEEYVEKVPNPSLKSEWGLTWGQGWASRARRACAYHLPRCSLAAFKPIDLSDLKRRSTQDAKKS